MGNDFRGALTRTGKQVANQSYDYPKPEIQQVLADFHLTIQKGNFRFLSFIWDPPVNWKLYQEFD
jgi:hypothetical protein